MESEKTFIQTNKDGYANVIIKEEQLIRNVSTANELEVKAPIKVQFSGTIKAPLEFLRQRLGLDGQIDPARSHIEVDRDNVEITLIFNENDHYNEGRVRGRLTEDKTFVAFGINSSKRWEPNELGEFFKMHRGFFVDKAQNMELVTQLKNFQATVNSRIEKQKSEKGDWNDSYSGVVDANIPGTFLINIPLFKGGKVEQLEVEFYASVSGRDVQLTLHSPGAMEAFEKLRNEVIDEVLGEMAKISPEMAILEK